MRQNTKQHIVRFLARTSCTSVCDNDFDGSDNDGIVVVVFVAVMVYTTPCTLIPSLSDHVIARTSAR
jgi:hypothetical protein